MAWFAFGANPVQVANNPTAITTPGPNNSVPLSNGTTFNAAPLAGSNLTVQGGSIYVTSVLKVYNVKDPQYGAKGDGTTDDGTAIDLATAAAKAAGGGTVFFPAGTYNRATEMDVDASVSLEGDSRLNSTILFTAATNGIVWGASSFFLQGGRIKRLTIQSSGAVDSGVGLCGLNVNKISNPRVEECSIYNWQQQGLYFTDCLMAISHHNFITHCGNAGYGQMEVDALSWGAGGGSTTFTSNQTWVQSPSPGTIAGLRVDRTTVVDIRGGSYNGGTPIIISGKVESTHACTAVSIDGLDIEAPTGIALAGTVTLTNGSPSLTFSQNQTLAAGTQFVFSDQPGVPYTLQSAISASTSGTLTTNYTGTGGSGKTTSTTSSFIDVGYGLSGGSDSVLAIRIQRCTMFEDSSSVYKGIRVKNAASVHIDQTSMTLAASSPVCGVWFEGNTVSTWKIGHLFPSTTDVCPLLMINGVAWTQGWTSSGASVGALDNSKFPVAVAVSTGTITLTSAQYSAEYIYLTGSLSGNVTVVLPAAVGVSWIIDATNVTLNANTITLKSNGANWSTTIGTTNIYRVTLGNDGKLHGVALTP